ncbi:MAG: hypothetical protein A2848_02410 [Candidatus Magasanikbacteria bacterium RIFCSPHIGHO2_01_FULL_50_8]|uniref:FCP1 homology domain-containing protein n=2 Tax=Candidatus Magasanikiibacteriota TaxID=1752731 RepID=A0A1F6LPF1_9BACT|nr:MAG: hypothetical protein A2848_02410 [Candidatus Magasanikbacteria bacterium RIFCSPHIGHO2_01_FULL_50_8]
MQIVKNTADAKWREPELIMKKRNILFIDFNGVLSYNKFWFSLENVNHPLSEYFQKIEFFLFKQHKDALVSWMRGEVTSEQVHALIAQNIGIDANDLYKIFIDDCAHIDISVEILTRVSTLRKYYHCILATDNMDSFHRFTLPHQPILSKTFDVIHSSALLGKCKADACGEYFLETIAACGAEVGNCVLLDDSAITCRIFSELGGQVYNTKTEQDAINALDLVINYVEKI